jgi:uncharacterized Tic20 family protein
VAQDPSASLPTHPLQVVYGTQGFSIGVSTGAYFKRGLFSLFALPALFALLLGLVMVLVAGQVDGEPPVYAFAALWCGMSGLSALWGLGLMLGAGRWSQRSLLAFDGQRWTVKNRDSEQSIAAFACVRARRPSRLLKWWALELVPHAGGKPLVIYGSFVPRQSRALLSYAHWLASMLRLPLDADIALSTLDSTGLDERTAAMLCYLPVQGVFIGASLYFVLKGDTRPLVRFSARQSLCQTLLSFVLLLLICAAFGVPIALLGDGPARIVAIVALAVSLVAFAVWNLWAHILACSRAYRKIAWVMPWLRPLVARWLPEA